ncbi:uncharacterized protein LOC126880650 [Diabrotica virgifera virgifera]|uniref:Uncharacterized protein n=2 Tax=Diabrotica virgifera virgifera TaxID=50390 RepID=A0ABM5JRT2_DIAVI|nr:uncharacterized protein LOC126880650 [Diabrotica virgifera virgifera]
MFCYLQYITYTDFCQFRKNYKSDDEATASAVIENKRLLFNPDCFIGIILDYIIEHVGIPRDQKENIDMIDEKMKFLNIQLYSPNYEGIELFNNKMEYYLVYKENQQVIPFLAPGTTKNQEFCTMMKKRKEKRRSSTLSAASKNSKKTNEVSHKSYRTASVVPLRSSSRSLDQKLETSNNKKV